MLAKVADEPFDGEKWLFEIKWDGYRAITEANDGKTDIYSRNGISFNIKYSSITDALSDLNHNVILDGEIVVLDEDGRSHFQKLQNFDQEEDEGLFYYVFDLLYLDDHALFEEKLTDRKELLKELVSKLGHPQIRYSDHVLDKGIDFFKEAQNSELEGIIAKKKNSKYLSGKRSRQWLKIKTANQQEAVIGGFTEPSGSRKYFGSLVLGVYENDNLQFIGQCGGGFSDKKLKELSKKIESLIIDHSPFTENNLDLNTPATWLKPELICEVSFAEWTESGSMRQPIFKGLRIDKEPEEVKREMTKESLESKNVNKTKKSKTMSKKKKKKNTKKKEKSIHIKGHELSLTNLDKVFWPDEGYTKGDVIEYYREVSNYILPYLKKRPQSMFRQPDGIESNSFFQKDVEDMPPEWVTTIDIYSESNDDEITYLVCNNKSTLTYMNQLGCIEINPWLSRTVKPDKPDYCIIDLDPDGNEFDEVVETAQAVKEVLDRAEANGYCKTSGATGMHIYIPLNGKYSYDQSRDFAELIASLTHELIPDLTSLERSPKKRKNKIYLDFLQNRQSQTLAAPYSLRPKPEATISTPLEWEEVKKGLTPQEFTIETIHDRLKDKGDLFKPVRGKGIDMEKCLQNLEK